MSPWQHRKNPLGHKDVLHNKRPPSLPLETLQPRRHGRRRGSSTNYSGLLHFLTCRWPLTSNLSDAQQEGSGLGRYRKPAAAAAAAAGAHASYQRDLNPLRRGGVAREGAWPGKGGAARVGGAEAGLREAKPGARKTGAPGACKRLSL